MKRCGLQPLVDLACAGVLELVEDDQRLVPGCPRGIRVAGLAVGVAEMAERVGFRVPVAGLTDERECLPVALGGLVEAGRIALPGKNTRYRSRYADERYNAATGLMIA